MLHNRQTIEITVSASAIPTMVASTHGAKAPLPPSRPLCGPT